MRFVLPYKWLLLLVFVGTKNTAFGLKEYRKKYPLHAAIWEDVSASAYENLIESHKAKINLPNSKGYTPIDCAVLANRFDLLQLLVRSGASLNLQTAPYGSSAMHLAVFKGNVSMLKLLLDKRPDMIDSITNFGSTPLHYVVYFCPAEKKIACLNLLLRYKPDTKISTYKGYTPTQLARAYGFSDIEERLIAYNNPPPS